MIFCKELERAFTSKEEMLDELKANKKQVMLAKKATIKRADAVPMMYGASAVKKSGDDSTELGYGDIVFPVINTTLWLDSHRDVHLNGIWNKSVKEQKGRVSLIINHDFSVGSVISFPDEVEPMVKTIPWKELGREYEGDTEALIFKSVLTEDSNATAFRYYKNRRPVQHSICMEYVKIHLCADSQDEDWVNENKNWEKYLPLIVNPENAIKLGYFWAVEEAKIYREGSMVLNGSNEVTPTLYEIGAEKFTPNEPDYSTQEKIKKINELINLTKL